MTQTSRTTPSGRRAHSSHTCSCGRTGLRSGGWVSHLRTCTVERARSEAFVAAIENGEDPHAAGAAAVRAALAAR